MNKKLRIIITIPLLYCVITTSSTLSIPTTDTSTTDSSSQTIENDIVPSDVHETQIINGTPSDVAIDDITYYIKNKIAQLNIDMSPEELEKIIEQAEDHVEKASQGPRNNRHIEDDKIQKIKDGFERYLKKNYP